MINRNNHLTKTPNNKMKQLAIILFLTSFLLGCKQDKLKGVNKTINETPSLQYEARRDSILVQTNYGSIYFTRDTTAKSYTFLNPKIIDSSIFKEIMPDMIASIETEHQSKIQHFNHDLMNTSWSSLYWFNNDFCLYSPSDWVSNSQILLTDSTCYFLASDPMLEILKTFKKVNTNQYKFTSVDYFGATRTTTIDIIDPEKGIAIWEYKYAANDSVVKELKVRSEKVKLFPMLICDCGDSKCVFERTDFFDTPNYTQLKETYSKKQ